MRRIGWLEFGLSRFGHNCIRQNVKRRHSCRVLEEQNIHRSELIYRNFLMRKGK